MTRPHSNVRFSYFIIVWYVLYCETRTHGAPMHKLLFLQQNISEAYKFTSSLFLLKISHAFEWSTYFFSSYKSELNVDIFFLGVFRFCRVLNSSKSADITSSSLHMFKKVEIGRYAFNTKNKFCFLTSHFLETLEYFLLGENNTLIFDKPEFILCMLNKTFKIFQW